MSRAALASRAPRLLSRSVRAVAVIGAAALGLTGEMASVVLFVFAALFLVGVRLASMPRVTRVVSALQPYLAAALFLLALLDFFRVSQSFLLAVAHFLLGLQAIRLLALDTTRENLGSVLVSSLMMLSAATLAIDWTFFLMLLLFLPTVVWTMMLHTIVLESQDASDRDNGRPALGEGSPAWTALASALRRSAAAAFGVTAFCCAVVFAVFPRFNLQGFRGQFLQPVHATGFTTQVDLNKAGRIFLDESIVMRIEVSPQEKSLWTGYVRGSALDEYDGRTWRRSPRAPRRLYPARENTFDVARSPAPLRLHQSIYLESMDTPVLFGVPRMATVKIDRPFLEVSDDGTVQRPNGDAWRIHYDVESVPGAAAAQRAPSLAPEEFALDTSIPVDVDAARRLANAEGGKGSNRAVAERLAAYLSRNYKYSLSLPPSEGRHPIDNFLEHSRVGHCEYFASSLCLMLRYRNIPARMVTGFLSREWNDQGNYFVVRMKDAHAWVEYFDPRRGWVEIDPSPRVPDGLSDAESALRRRMKGAWDYLNLRWNRYILSYDIDRQVAILRAVTDHSGRLSIRLERTVIHLHRWFRGGGWRQIAPAMASGRLKIDWKPFLPSAAVAVVLAGLFAAVRRRSRDHVWFYRRLVERLAALGAGADPSRTLRERLAEAAPRLSDARAEADFLEAAYYRARFDPAHHPTRDERRRIRRALAALGA